MVKKMLMTKSAPHPRSNRTPTGGRMMARMILQMSEAVKGIVGVEREGGKDKAMKYFGLWGTHVARHVSLMICEIILGGNICVPNVAATNFCAQQTWASN